MIPPLHAIRRKASPQDVAALEDYLRRQTDWRAAEQIGFSLGWSDRKVRRTASASDQIVSHPGHEGYKLEEQASEEEFEHFGKGLRAQARTMIWRWLRARRKRRERQLSQGLLPL